MPHRDCAMHSLYGLHKGLSALVLLVDVCLPRSLQLHANRMGVHPVVSAISQSPLHMMHGKARKRQASAVAVRSTGRCTSGQRLRLSRARSNTMSAWGCVHARAHASMHERDRSLAGDLRTRCGGLQRAVRSSRRDPEEHTWFHAVVTWRIDARQWPQGAACRWHLQHEGSHEGEHARKALPGSCQ